MTATRALRAQQKTIPVAGFLHSLSPNKSPQVVAAFRQGLGEAGYIEGQNVAIQYRWAEGRCDRLPALAADLVDASMRLDALMRRTKVRAEYLFITSPSAAAV